MNQARKAGHKIGIKQRFSLCLEENEMINIKRGHSAAFKAQVALDALKRGLAHTINTAKLTMFETMQQATSEPPTTPSDTTIKQSVKIHVKIQLENQVGATHGRLYVDTLRKIERPLLAGVMRYTHGN